MDHLNTPIALLLEIPMAMTVWFMELKFIDTNGRLGSMNRLKLTTGKSFQ